MTAEQTVDALIAALERKDLDEAVTYMAEDIEYDNVPIGKVFGATAVREMLEPFLAGFASIEWRILHQTASADAVMNERVDRFQLTDGSWRELAVAGVFEVADGKVRLWRDYFDMTTFSAAFSPG